MPSIIDRYILRETLRMVFLSLLVLTFVLMLQPIMGALPGLMAKGIDGWTIAQLMLLLVPSALGITIPMAVLIGLLMGFGRLSGDREAVAMQACGISIYRMLRPVALLATVAAAATIYVLMVALPGANQAYREIFFRIVTSQAEDEVTARVFYQGFAGRTLYVQDVDTEGTGWSNVFLRDSSNPETPKVFIAKQGRVVIDHENRTADIVLTSGGMHTVDPADPAIYNTDAFGETHLSLDPDSIFPRGGPEPGLREMTVPQLQAALAIRREQGASPHNEIMEIHKRFSLPVACLVLAIIGLALGVTSRRDGKLASFAIGIGVIFAYWSIMFLGEGMAKGNDLSPHLAMWMPNIGLGVAGVALLVWRARSAGQRVSLTLPFLGRGTASTRPAVARRDGARRPAVTRHAGGLRASASWSGGGVFNLLDRYVGTQYLKVLALTFVGLLGIFYIATFVDISDKLFKGDATARLFLEYFWYSTPQFVWWVLPIAALVATLVTVGALTKSSELTVMKACGISLYRVSMPVLALSLLWSAVLFGLSESILGDANHQAEATRHVINGNAPETFDVLNRTWFLGPEGSIYHYAHFDPDRVELSGVTIYRFAEDEWRLTGRTYATQATYDNGWQGRDVWRREFGDQRGTDDFEPPRPSELIELAPPEYFTTDQPAAARMSYRDLSRYIGELEASGGAVVPLQVDLQRKLSFPLVTLVLTLIAVPFAVTTGRHGAMYGVGIGIVLAFSYWLVASIFAAIGSAGLLTPLLAAWTPNVLFGGSAVYLLLTIRT